jgi:hypothetical protein
MAMRTLGTALALTLAVIAGCKSHSNYCPPPCGTPVVAPRPACPTCPTPGPVAPIPPPPPM